MGWPIASPAE
jgi:hypothetical protein